MLFSHKSEWLILKSLKWNSQIYNHSEYSQKVLCYSFESDAAMNRRLEASSTFLTFLSSETIMPIIRISYPSGTVMTRTILPLHLEIPQR